MTSERYDRKLTGFTFKSFDGELSVIEEDNKFLFRMKNGGQTTLDLADMKVLARFLHHYFAPHCEVFNE